MQLGADVRQAAGPVHQGGQNVRSQGVGLEDLGKFMHSQLTCLLLVADRGIVDDRVEGAEIIGRRSKRTGLAEVGEITGEHRFASDTRVLGPLVLRACATTV